MKKLLVSICLMAFVSLGFGQATTKVTKDSLNYREKYEVLKSNPQIKQGEYRLSAISTGKLLTTGFYKNNLKDGKWHEYNNDGYAIVEGTYKDGKKVGEWSYFGKLWVVNNKYNFDTNRLTYHKGIKDDSTTFYKVIRGRDTINTIMQRPPIYLSGNDIILRTLKYNLSYPAKARAAKTQGRVIVAFTVDEHGHTRDYKVLQSQGPALDQEALRVVKTIPDDWVAGVLDGKAVPVILQIPVNFQLI